jgi:hypothetical protein
MVFGLKNIAVIKFDFREVEPSIGFIIFNLLG